MGIYIALLVLKTMVLPRNDSEGDSHLETNIQLVENLMPISPGDDENQFVELATYLIISEDDPFNNEESSKKIWTKSHGYKGEILMVSCCRSQTEREQNLKLDEQLSLSEQSPSLRPAGFFTDILVDPSGQSAVVSCYQGRLKVLMLEDGVYIKDVDLLDRDLTVGTFTSGAVFAMNIRSRKPASRAPNTKDVAGF
ncbi:hypothetical protein EDD18DRAFT_1389041 [Armillaria luteobubalina]|uniref:CNH domain-containing protein n=1 Tax=Armillaria luteobubalina TaxID=153913 RepID=A0AA39Q7I7_9AGAR|nr:hypothetical protein EDD18DRAFT_1389041 [Armillaria luteobubalina]